MPRIARPELPNKKCNKDKTFPRLTPRQCREVKAYLDLQTEERKNKTVTNEERERAMMWGVPVNENRPSPKTTPKLNYELPRQIAKEFKVEKVERRNPGRMDGVTWKADSYISPRMVDGYDDDDVSSDIDYNDYPLDFEESESDDEVVTGAPQFSVSLADLVIPKPTKQRSRAKGFEIVPTVSRVIVADDEFSDDEDWEDLETRSPSELSDEAPKVPSRSYAQVVLTG